MNNTLLYLVTEDWYFISHRLNLALEAQKKGFRVCVACRNSGRLDEIKAYGIECYPLDWNRGSLNVFSVIKGIIETRRVLHKVKPQIFHLVSIQSIITGCIATLFNDKIGKVLAFTGLGTLVISENIRVKFLRFILSVVIYFCSRNKLTKILVQNIDDQKLLIRKFYCSKSNVDIIRGSGVDIKYYCYQHEPEYPPFIVTYVGRFLKDKGIETLVKAFSIINENNLDIKLLLVGAPDSANSSSISINYLKQAIKENKNIQWEGEVSDIRKIWKKSHIAVLPSKREGLPMSLLEAAASGKPIVSTDVPGCREIAIEGLNAVTFEVDNIVKLANAIIYLCNNDKIRKEFGIRSRKLVESDMSEEEVIKKTIEKYEKLCVQL